MSNIQFVLLASCHNGHKAKQKRIGEEENGTHTHTFCATIPFNWRSIHFAHSFIFKQFVFKIDSLCPYLFQLSLLILVLGNKQKKWEGWRGKVGQMLPLMDGSHCHCQSPVLLLWKSWMAGNYTDWRMFVDEMNEWRGAKIWWICVDASANKRGKSRKGVSLIRKKIKCS